VRLPTVNPPGRRAIEIVGPGRGRDWLSRLRVRPGRLREGDPSSPRPAIQRAVDAELFFFFFFCPLDPRRRFTVRPPTPTSEEERFRHPCRGPQMARNQKQHLRPRARFSVREYVYEEDFPGVPKSSQRGLLSWPAKELLHILRDADGRCSLPLFVYPSWSCFLLGRHRDTNVRHVLTVGATDHANTQEESGALLAALFENSKTFDRRFFALRLQPMRN